MFELTHNGSSSYLRSSGTLPVTAPPFTVVSFHRIDVAPTGSQDAVGGMFLSSSGNDFICMEYAGLVPAFGTRLKNTAGSNLTFQPFAKSPLSHWSLGIMRVGAGYEHDLSLNGSPFIKNTAGAQTLAAADRLSFGQHDDNTPSGSFAGGFGFIGLIRGFYGDTQRLRRMYNRGRFIFDPSLPWALAFMCRGDAPMVMPYSTVTMPVSTATLGNPCPIVIGRVPRGNFSIGAARSLRKIGIRRTSGDAIAGTVKIAIDESKLHAIVATIEAGKITLAVGTETPVEATTASPNTPNSVPVIGGRIVSDVAQNDATSAKLLGLSAYSQVSTGDTRAERLKLFASAAAPVASAISIEIDSTLTEEEFNLASFVQDPTKQGWYIAEVSQPAKGQVSIDPETQQIIVYNKLSASLTAGEVISFSVTLQSIGPLISQTVVDVIGTVKTTAPPITADDLKPFGGKFWGNSSCLTSLNADRIDNQRCGVQFEAPRNGTVDHFRWNVSSNFLRAGEAPEQTKSKSTATLPWGGVNPNIYTTGGVAYNGYDVFNDTARLYEADATNSNLLKKDANGNILAPLATWDFVHDNLQNVIGASRARGKANRELMFWGSHVAGSVISATANKIKLPAVVDLLINGPIGCNILISGGPGYCEQKIITAFNTTTREATVDSDWGTIPTNGSKFKIDCGLGFEEATFTASTITLPSRFTTAGDRLIGKEVYIWRNQGSGQRRTIVSRIGLVCTLNSNWATTPNSGSLGLVILNPPIQANAALTKGKRYHLVCSSRDAQADNWCVAWNMGACDGIRPSNLSPPQRFSPAMGDLPKFSVESATGTFGQNRPHLPQLELVYDDGWEWSSGNFYGKITGPNGGNTGRPYMKSYVGGNNQVREIFTMQDYNIDVTGIWLAASYLAANVPTDGLTAILSGPDIDTYEAKLPASSWRDFSENQNSVVGWPIYAYFPFQTGTLVAGTSGGGTLPSTFCNRDNFYNGCQITITSGPGAGQTRTIEDYTGSTKVFTVVTNWTTTPTSASKFSINKVLTLNKTKQYTLLFKSTTSLTNRFAIYATGKFVEGDDAFTKADWGAAFNSNRVKHLKSGQTAVDGFCQYSTDAGSTWGKFGGFGTSGQDYMDLPFQFSVSKML